MSSKKIIFILVIILDVFIVRSQLKFIIEDFEGFANGNSHLKLNGTFTYGNLTAQIEQTKNKENLIPDYLGDRFITVKRENKKDFGGWGKGIGLNIELDAGKDQFNFYFLYPYNNSPVLMKIHLQEDDNDNTTYEKESDDDWAFTQELEPNSSWQLISIPLNKFKDSNPGGDGIFNCTYKKGKLLCLIFELENPKNVENGQSISFDFLSFSQGALIRETSGSTDFCSLGIWSKEGNTAQFSDIASNFEGLFKNESKKKLAVVHFFQPFAVDGGNKQNHYPSVERINKVIKDGYIPMITLENHFLVTDHTIKQPNLYSIIEGHFDSFFGYWADQIKQVNGIVLLRILHEFNGDWYPWCIAKNDKNPELLINAYRHIYTIFKENKVTNVKFIWCPNSMSVPQEKWNYIMDAYPGDEYVDFTGLDIYNGAGQLTSIWMSFRKVGIENYFTLTNKISKPLLVCETASKEQDYTGTYAQSKAEWIAQQSEALQTDMNKIKLLSWFNEKSTFRINSSQASQKAFLDHIIKKDYFKSGTTDFNALIR